MIKDVTQKLKDEKSEFSLEKPVCGIVMPISPIDGLSSDHWLEVLGIIKEVATSENFDSKLVSAADESGIIQQRIIQNLYTNDIVICDVSGKNPNVMFELGMRLAFDKATIVIKDDGTDYSFDTSPLEHIEYPRDLRFTKILNFKQTLAAKLKATYERSKQADYSTFLRHFGTFNVKGLKEREGGISDYVISTLEGIKTEISNLRKGTNFIPLAKARLSFDLDNFLNVALDEHAKKTGSSRYDILEDSKELLKLVDIIQKDIMQIEGKNFPKDTILKSLKEQLPF